MKNHTTYTKIEAPYFNLSEFLFFPILPIAFIFVVSGLALYFFGLIPTLVINAILALIASYIYFGLKNATPNGSSHSTKSDKAIFLSILPIFLLLLVIEFIVSIGAYLLVTYKKTGVFYSWYFDGWMFIVLGLPVLYFVSKQLSYHRVLRSQATHFRPLSLSIVYDIELQLYIKEIVFLNTKNNLAGVVSVDDRRYIPDADQFLKLPLSERNDDFYKPVFSETIYIPKDTDKLKIAWYSSIEDTFYQDEIDFPFQKLSYEENKYPLNESQLMRGEKTKPVTLSIREEGKVHLYNRETDILGPTNAKAIPTDKTKKRELLGTSLYEYLEKNKQDQEAANAALARVKQRSKVSDFVCNWQITGNVTEGTELAIAGIRKHEAFGRNIKTGQFRKGPLPILVALSYDNYTWLKFHIDADQLYKTLHETGKAESDVTFEITMDPEKADANLSVKSETAVLPFNAFEKDFEPDSREVVRQKLQKKKTDNEKNELWKRVYEFIQQKAYIEAQKLCKEALEQYPDFSLMYFYEARLLWYTQGFEASYSREPYFVEKTQEDPLALSRIYNHYGCLLEEEKRYEESLSYFEKAANVHPEETMYLANIAELNYKLNNIPRALQYADECIQRGYTSDMLKEILGMRE